MPVQYAAGNIETFTLGGSTVETHDSAAISTANTDFLGNQITVVFIDGTPASNSFAGFARSKARSLTIDMVTGKWNSSTGSSGTLSGAQLTALQNNQRNLKNGMENIANAIGIIPGTIVAWT